MDAFEQTIAVVSALCLGIFAVSIFFNLLVYLNRFLQGTSNKSFVAQNFINKDSIVTVALTGEEKIEGLKFLGYTTAQKEPIPHQFLKMAVFENETHEKIFIPALNIKYIKELPPQAASPSP